MRYLCDVNVVLPILVSSHVHRAVALAWFDGLAREDLGLCTHVRLAILRLLCHRTVMGEDVQTPDDAWSALRSFEMDERVAFFREPEGYEVNLRANISGRETTPNLWSDAYLAAMALRAGLRMVTFDGGFRSFPSLGPLVLASEN